MVPTCWLTLVWGNSQAHSYSSSPWGLSSSAAPHKRVPTSAQHFRPHGWRFGGCERSAWFPDCPLRSHLFLRDSSLSLLPHFSSLSPPWMLCWPQAPAPEAKTKASWRLLMQILQSHTIRFLLWSPYTHITSSVSVPLFAPWGRQPSPCTLDWVRHQIA